MTMKIPEKKIIKLKLKIEKILSRCNNSIRQVSELLGILNSNTFACLLGSLYCKRLKIERIHAFKVNKGDFDATIPDGSISDLRWWYSNIECMASPIRKEPPSLEIFTDASLTVGGGAVHGDLRTGGPWSQVDISNYPHII